LGHFNPLVRAAKGPRAVRSATANVIYLTTSQVCARFGGVSRMWLWRYMRQHGFPAPVQFGGPRSVRHWHLDEIEAWEREHGKRVGCKAA
jgi:predicted DNA-binding transcriptional regulator AlpA